ncbi:hypothetical protein [Bdellovibrio sp. HCB209]|uniref:hypothetical protein n=1 Tax=Bdellovibrio sp. HCB209 TaxID=3394354 RepID=UPI0039B46DA7
MNPRHTSVTQRILSYKGYDDIRIDKDLDGSVDEWFLKKADTQIHVVYKMKALQTLEITKFIRDRVLIKKFDKINGKLLLTNHEDRSMQVMHGTPDKEICNSTGLNSSLQNKVFSLNQDIAAIMAKPAVNSVPQNCNINKYPVFAENLGGIGDLLSANTERITKCLEKVQKVNDVDLNLVSAKFKLVVGKISTGNSAQIYSCQLTDQNNVSGEATEDGKIKFLIPSDKQDPVIEPDAMVSLFLHEILHISGIKSDQTNDYILKLCLNEDSEKIGTSNIAILTNKAVQKSLDKSAAEESANTKAATFREAISTSKKTKRELASTTENLGAKIDMKSEITNAESIVPSAEKLNVAKVDKSPEGKAQAVRDSVQESAPLFRTANQVMGAANTPAIADSSSDSSQGYNPTYASSSGSRSSSSSSSSSSSYSGDSEVSSGSRASDRSSTRERYQSRHGRYKADSSSGVGKDEYIAEEIDLTKTQGSRTNSNSRSGANTRGATQYQYQTDTSAGVDRGTQAANNARGPASASEVSGSTRRGPAGSSGGGDNIATGSTGSASLSMDTSSVGSSASGGGSNSRNASRNRAANSASRAPASSTNKGSPEQRRELMSTLVDSNYSETRKKLRDSSFQSELSDNQITIIDMNGGRWGSSNGAVIYLDNGDRFIRQR